MLVFRRSISLPFLASVGWAPAPSSRQYVPGIYLGVNTERCGNQSRFEAVRNLGYDCRNCDRSFSTAEGLHQHEMAKHPRHNCGYCDRSFASREALNQHMQTLHPKKTKCPACGEAKFRSLTSALQHLESGQCPNCHGKQHARSQVYEAISPHLARGTRMPLLAAGPSRDQHKTEKLPEFPYQCDQCTRKFRELNHLMQHKGAKHKTTILPTLPGGSKQYLLTPKSS